MDDDLRMASIIPAHNLRRLERIVALDSTTAVGCGLDSVLVCGYVRYDRETRRGPSVCGWKLDGRGFLLEYRWLQVVEIAR